MRLNAAHYLLLISTPTQFQLLQLSYSLPPTLSSFRSIHTLYLAAQPALLGL